MYDSEDGEDYSAYSLEHQFIAEKPNEQILCSCGPRPRVRPGGVESCVHRATNNVEDAEHAILHDLRCHSVASESDET